MYACVCLHMHMHVCVSMCVCRLACVYVGDEVKKKAAQTNHVIIDYKSRDHRLQELDDDVCIRVCMFVCMYVCA